MLHSCEKRIKYILNKCLGCHLFGWTGWKCGLFYGKMAAKKLGFRKITKLIFCNFQLGRLTPKCMVGQYYINALK